MENLENIIFDAIEGNAVDFQQGITDELYARSLEAIEQLRPQIAADMFGEQFDLEEADSNQSGKSKEMSWDDRVAARQSARAKQKQVARERGVASVRAAFGIPSGNVRKEEVELDDVQEVARPKSPSDKVAMNVPINKKDHPIANEVQFTARNEKDKSKKASYHAGEDEVAYHTAQNVGIPTKE
jgi:hypothetical protein